jgi:hypothetical protein
VEEGVVGVVRGEVARGVGAWVREGEVREGVG